VRAASVTCFAGLTSAVFSSLPKKQQDFVLTSSINAALNDEVPSVRSAACRAIGVITCFPQISQRFGLQPPGLWQISVILSVIILMPLPPNGVPWVSFLPDSTVISQLIALLIECCLRLTEDSDKAAVTLNTKEDAEIL
ncbi:hypothetical protein U1Q18_019911, partial [Sarracenia purpurea var. burkii]